MKKNQVYEIANWSSLLEIGQQKIKEDMEISCIDFKVLDKKKTELKRGQNISEKEVQRCRYHNFFCILGASYQSCRGDNGKRWLRY